MKASCLVLAAAGFAAAVAQAQLVEPASGPQLQHRPQPQNQAFDKSFQPLPRPYMSNETADPGARFFPEYRTDPRLTAGFDLNPNVALETGYGNLFSSGFHYVWPGDAAGLAGALGSGGSASYLAGKLTVPVDDGLTAYGKLGVGVSTRKFRDSAISSFRETDVGPYASVGARYKLNDKASVNAQYEQHGDSARKFGNDSNASGMSAKLNLGF